MPGHPPADQDRRPQHRPAHQEFAAAAASPEAERAAVDGAYGLACTALDFLVDDDLAADVKEEFEHAGGAIDVAHYFD